MLKYKLEYKFERVEWTLYLWKSGMEWFFFPSWVYHNYKESLCFATPDLFNAHK